MNKKLKVKIATNIDKSVAAMEGAENCRKVENAIQRLRTARAHINLALLALSKED